MPFKIEWVKCAKYRDAIEYEGVIYLHEIDDGPFYWGKAHRSSFGVRYNSGYRHWIEGSLKGGGCLYIGILDNDGLEVIDELEMQLIHQYGTVMNQQIVEPSTIRDIQHVGEVPVSITNNNGGFVENTPCRDGTLADHLASVVPTGSNVKKSLNLYRQYMNAANDEEPSRMGFIDWQRHAEQIPDGTAQANWWPLSEINGLGVLNKSDGDLEILRAGGYDALTQVVGMLAPEHSGRCLKCTFLVGDTQGMEPADRTAALIERGCVDVPGSAALLLSVGKSFGRHFGLIDEDGNSTANYEEYFADWRAMG